MTEQEKKMYNKTLKESMVKFFDIYDDFNRGIYNIERDETEYKRAMLEATNVMMMHILKELED